MDYRARQAQKTSLSPDSLVARLRTLHERLPPPGDSGKKATSPSWSLVTDVWDSCYAYEQALRAMTAPDNALDDRLRAVYGRLHVQGLKVAIILAALDWADHQAESKPIVQAAHWFRAQQIVETWRASAHRLLRELGESEDSRLEGRILRLLKAHPEGMTARRIYKYFRAPRKAVLETLNALEQDNQVKCIAGPANGRPGPKTNLYSLVME